MSDKTFTVPGMTCGHCVNAVRTELSAVSGVTSVDIDPDTKSVVVRGTSLDVAALAAAVDEAGYEAVGLS